MAITNPINHTHYNTLQAKVDTVLGIGTGELGYGETLLSSQVSAGTTITSSQWDNLVTDIERIRRHQHGNTYIIPTDVYVKNVHYTEVHSLVSSATLVNTATITLLSTELDAGVADRFLLAEGEYGRDVVYSPSLTGWIGRKVHTVRASFGSADQARNFFNAGGTIEFVAGISGLPTSPGHKSYTWSMMLSDTQSPTNDSKYGMGRVEFGRRNSLVHNGLTGTLSTGTGVVTTSVGWQTLRQGVQTQLFHQSVQAVVNAAAADLAGSTDPTHDGYYMYHSAYQYQFGTSPDGVGSFYRINVTKTSSSEIEFLIIFNDSTNTGHTVDEPVLGTLVSSVVFKHPMGGNVSLPSPTVTANYWA